MEMYARYIKEREGKELIHNGYGFLSYRIKGKECFIADIFVEKPARKIGHGKTMIDVIVSHAKNEGCEFVSGTIYLWDPNANSTLKAALASGFEVVDSNNGVLMVVKKIKR